MRTGVFGAQEYSEWEKRDEDTVGRFVLAPIFSMYIMEGIRPKSIQTFFISHPVSLYDDSPRSPFFFLVFFCMLQAHL